MGGISCIIALVEAICTLKSVNQGSLWVGLDVEQAQKESVGTNPLCSTQPSFDLLTDIRNKIARSNIDFQFFWVKGHQRETTGHKPYERDLNEIGDDMAKSYRSTFLRFPIHPVQRFSDEGWSLTYGGVKSDHVDSENIYI